jgi:hypothetical protein
MEVEAIKAFQSEMRSEMKAFQLASELQGEMMHVQMKEIQSEMKALHHAVSLAAGHSLGRKSVCEPAVYADALPNAMIFPHAGLLTRDKRNVQTPLYCQHVTSCEKRHEKLESAQGGTAEGETRQTDVCRAAVELADENVRRAAV